MKNIQKIFVTAITAALVGMSSASAIVTISASFSPILNGGVDTNGFVGSTWIFTYQLSDPVYSDYFGGPAVLSSSASLTITGASNSVYNDDFTLVESTTTNFLFWPNYAGTAFLSYNPNSGSESSFTIGSGSNTLLVQALAFVGPSTASVSIGGPVEASHFDGLVVSDTGISVGDTVYGFNNGTVTVVPEPSMLPLVVGFSAGIVLFSRRRRRGKITC